MKSPNRIVALTPSDTVDFPVIERFLINKAAATSTPVKVVTAGDDTVTMTLATNVWHDMRIKRVWVTGSTIDAVFGAF